jgi:hypothetical protein
MATPIGIENLWKRQIMKLEKQWLVYREYKEQQTGNLKVVKVQHVLVVFLWVY